MKACAAPPRSPRISISKEYPSSTVGPRTVTSRDIIEMIECRVECGAPRTLPLGCPPPDRSQTSPRHRAFDGEPRFGGALQLLRIRHPDQQPMLDQVVLAAPDLDADEFRDRYVDAVKSVARRVTLYASATDRALLASVRLHGHRRLGLTSTPQPTVMGVDLIDVTPVDTSLLGHSYYGSHPLMIRELMSLVHQGIPPEQRTC